MAIQVTYFDQYGANHTSAYCKVLKTDGFFDWDRRGTERDHCDVTLGVFHSLEARTTHAEPLIVVNFKITGISERSLVGFTSWLNFVYSQIKTDAFFTSRGGVDV